jgi:MarR family transcriptional regulator, transcriptional regulator for hemolysin
MMNIPPDESLMQQVMATLMVLSRSYRSAADKALVNYGLSQATAWPVLVVGRLGDGIRQGALAEALGVEAPSVVRVIDQLDAAGLIERRESPEDRRARTLHLTEAGHAMRDRIEDVLVDFRRELFKDIDVSDLQACQRVFDTLKTSLGRLRAAPAEREA